MSDEYNISKIYTEMEKEIMASMQRNLSRHIKEEKLVGFDFSQWQAEKLRSLRKYQIENAKIINSYTDGLPVKIKAILQDELKQSTLAEMEKFKEALAAGYESSVVMKDSFFKINARKVNNLIKSVNNDIVKANQACLRYVDDAYRQVIFKSEMFVANGVYTEQKAVDKAIEEFEKRGLHCIEYSNGSYHDIADYADMAVKTASQRAQLIGEGEFRKKIGNHLIIISKHGGTCPLCAKWEGKILIDDVYSGGTRADGNYPLLSEAMAAGLYHPRCRHGAGTYYPEVDDIWNDDYTENEHFTSSSDYAVPKDLISKREFRNKFNSMSKDKNMQRMFYQVSKKMLKHRSGTNGEDIYIYNTKKNKWYSSTSGTEALTPTYNDEIKKALNDADFGELIAFHNHPSGNPPSANDLNAALFNRYLEGYTIGHNGVIYQYTAPKKEIDTIIYEKRIESYIKKGYNETEAQIMCLNDLQCLYEFTFNEVM